MALQLINNMKVSIYNEASVEIINKVADAIRLGLLEESGYMLENLPWSGRSYDMRIEGLEEDFVCALALQRDVASNTEIRYYLTLNSLPLPYRVNIGMELSYGRADKLYNYLTSEEGIADVRHHLRELLLSADDWRKDQDE